MSLLALVFICIELATIKVSGNRHLYPWSQECQQAVYCNLVHADVLKESGKTVEEVAHLLIEANEIVTKYLSVNLDFKRFKEIVKSLSANGNSVIDVDDIDPDVDTQLEAFGVELLDQATLDEMYGEAEVNVVTSPIRFIYVEECTEKLTNCTDSIEELAKRMLPISLHDCPWQSYPYNWFRCEKTAYWPVNLTSSLDSSFINCNELSECQEFVDWEGVRTSGGHNLPQDWELRRAKSGSDEEFDMQQTKQEEKDGEELVNPELRAGSGISTSDDNVNNVKSLSGIALEIHRYPDHIVSKLNADLDLFQVNYTSWLMCDAMNSYFHEFRLIQTVHGFAGMELNCRRHKSVYRHSPGNITTSLGKTFKKPMQSCDGDSLLIGFNLVYLKYSTWAYYIHTLQGICSSDYHTEYNIPALTEPEGDITTRPLRCPQGQAVCALRLNFQTPYLYTYERVYDVQIFCCDIELVCRYKRALRVLEFHQYDNFKNEMLEITFEEPVGYEQGKLTRRKAHVGLAYHDKDNITTNIKQNMIEETIRKIYPRNVGRRPNRWVEPDFNKEKFTSVTFRSHKHTVNESYVYKFYKQVLLCDSLVYYFDTGFRIIRELSAKSCNPRIIEQYVPDHSYVTAYVENVTLGVSYESVRHGVVSYKGFLSASAQQNMKWNNSADNSTAKGVLDIDATVEGLQETFEKHNLFLEKKYFHPITTNSRINLERPAYFISQAIGVCNSITESYKVYTDNLTIHFQPAAFCANGNDHITLVDSFENEHEPNGLLVSYELQIGIHWKGKPENIKFPRGATNTESALFNHNLNGISMYTQVVGWNETRRRNYLTGVYKKTYSLEVPFMRKLQVFQVVGKCDQWYYFTGFKFYRILDFDSVCLGGYSEGKNTFDCERKTKTLWELYNVPGV